MKRFIIFLLTALFIISANIYAEESVLIDFSKLAADYNPGGQGTPTENTATMIDFSDMAGVGFTEEEKALMKTSLALRNWEVELASSSKTVRTIALSMAKGVTVKEDAKVFAGQRVLGVRVHFPQDPFNSWAMVKPPFEIPMYMQKTILQDDGSLVPDPEDKQGTKFDGYGVIKNVGTIKSIAMNILGLNFPMGVELVLKDQQGDLYSYFMGYLNFDGWRQIIWNNPNYIEEVRDRELKRQPLYPKATPAYKLIGIRFLRDKEQEGGDFITYIKDISMTYDRALLDLEMDINHEEVWGILSEREASRRMAEFRKLGQLQVLRSLEQKKMHREEPALPGTTTRGGTQPQPEEGGATQ
ncbi:MAG: flagellar protein [Spirochaetes bacterium]|nr:MAG: flagellar protein [Spirochaetota bacterium]